MAQVFIIGAAGKVGRHLVKQLADKQHRVLALHRRAEQGAELGALGATPVTGDLTAIDVGSWRGRWREVTSLSSPPARAAPVLK